MRTLLAFAALAALALPAPAHAAEPQKPKVELRTQVCETYEDGSGLCGKAHWETGAWASDGVTFMTGGWVFDRVDTRFCVKGNACTADAPDSWGDR